MTTQESMQYLQLPFTCTNCQSVGANLQCFTCGAYYCGVMCQHASWPKHREQCIPRLVMASAVFTKVTQYPPPAVSKQLIADLMKNNSNTQAHMPVKDAKTKLQQKVYMNQKEKSPHLEIVQQNKSNDLIPKSNMAQRGKNVVTSSNSGTAQKFKNKEHIFSKIQMSQAALEKAKNKSFPSKENKSFLQGTSNEPEPVGSDKNNKQNANCTTAPHEKAAKEKKNNSLTEGDVLQAGHFPDPGSKVKISHVAHDKMFIYHVERGPNGEPNQFETLIKRCIEKSRQVKSHFTVQPKVNDIVFAPFEDEFYRAIVKEIKGNKALIFYPDFGNSETMEWSMLKEIPDPNIKYANTFTHPVWIDNISEFTAPIREFLQTLIDEQEFILTTVIDVPKTSIKMVDMRHVQEKYILSTKLLTIPGNKTEDRKPIVSCPPLAKKIQTATKFVVPNPETYKRVGVEELKELEINEGKGMELIIVNASQAFEENLLTVVHKSHLSQYETLLRDCQHYGKIDKNPYEPDNDEACLIQLCEFWHRAIYIEPSDITGGQFYLLDDATCTNMETVSSIRRYPPAMSRKLFVLEGVLENAQNLLKSIDGNKQNVNMLPGKTLKADLHLSKDDELGETTHITVLSID